MNMGESDDQQTNMNCRQSTNLQHPNAPSTNNPNHDNQQPELVLEGLLRSSSNPQSESETNVHPLLLRSSDSAFNFATPNDPGVVGSNNNNLMKPSLNFTSLADSVRNFSFFGGNGCGGGAPGPSSNNNSNVDPSFTMDSIGGLQEHKDFLTRAVTLPLLHKAVLKSWGMHPPKGILMHGPPGTGKTYMTKSLVNELKKTQKHVKFFYRKGGDMFSPFFGESEARLRRVFAAAKAEAPSILFFDEIDGLCPSRENPAHHGTEAYAAVVTCFLGEMDAIVPGQVLVIAATNRLEAVDPAVRRPGRFDKQLLFGYPNEEARKQILKIHTSKWKSRQDKPGPILTDTLAKKTVGFSGADLEKFCKDVIYATIEANGGKLTADMRITADIWLDTVAKTKPMRGNVFGSGLYTPVIPDTTVKTLIEPAVTQVLEYIRTLVVDKPETMAESQSRGCRHNSLLLFKESKTESPSFLNDQILNGILSHGIFNTMTLIDLNPVNLLNQVITGSRPTLLAAINSVMWQAENAKVNVSRSVLVAPNIDILVQLCASNHISVETLQKILLRGHGPDMLLLGTCSVNPEQIPSILPLFGGGRHGISVRSPSRPQLKQFFHQYLPNLNFNASEQAGVNSALERILEYAANGNFTTALHLASHLNQIDFARLVDTISLKEKLEDLLCRIVKF